MTFFDAPHVYLSRHMIRTFILSVFLFIYSSSCLMAQEDPDILLAGMLDSTALSQQKTYRNLSDALANPDSVFKLDLSKQKRKEVPEQIR